MDRRTFMTASVAVAGCAMPWLNCYGVLNHPTVCVRTLVIFDSSLSVSRAFVADSREEGTCAMDVGPDVGSLWHARLRDWPGTIAGVLRPSDCFVLRNSSIAEGRSFHSATVGPGAIALQIVWRTVQKDLPGLLQQVQALVDSLPEPNDMPPRA